MTEKTARRNTGWTRRNFLERVGMAGGAAAVYESMVALGLIRTPGAWAGPPQLTGGSGTGKSVLILGAGIGGLTAAYNLSRAGYSCRILEAASRAGGRNHTARRGSRIVERGPEHGRTEQECLFDDGLYLNLGPGRLPYHHRRVLGYCQELNVALEPYVMNTTGNLFQTSQAFEGAPQAYRRMQNDTRGHVAELLAKAIVNRSLDDQLDGEDRARLLGALNVDQTTYPAGYDYPGSTRTGCGPDPTSRPTPNVGYNCETSERTPLHQLLSSRFWEHSFYDPFEFEWQPTLFQPVGGMDMIVEGFMREVGELVTTDAPVSDIQVRENGVDVTYQEQGRSVTATADYCVSNIPCSVLKNIKSNFVEDPGFDDAVRRTNFAPSCKVGWQSNTRFWESEKYEIYGGISWTDDIIEQIWYPSNGYFGRKGTLTGAYIHGPNAASFGKLGLAERLRVAREGGARLHDEFDDPSILPPDLGLSIAWQNVPHQEGAWADWGNYNDNQHCDEDYRRLLEPFRRFYVVGDQASTLPGWQEGAMMSAEWVVGLIGGLKPAEIPDGIKAPNSLKVTQGRG